MKTFLIVCCLAYAAGQGYNYPTVQAQSNYLAPASGNVVQGSPGPQGYSYQGPAVHTAGNVAGHGGAALGGGVSSGGVSSHGSLGGVSFHGGAVGGGSFTGGVSSGGAHSVGSFNAGSFGGAVGNAAVTGSQGGAQVGGFLSGSLQSSGLQGGVSSGGHVGVSGGNYQGGNVRTEYLKEFFTYHVDDKEYINVNQVQQNSGTHKKNIRVVIIKGPEISALEDAAVSLHKNVNEQKLAIYVLSKQADIGALTQKLITSDIQINSKPEVHYVKYKTDDDAEKAKEAIHKQYESLEGPSSTQDGGQVPVHTFASKAEEVVSAPAPEATTAPAPGYLPSSVL